MPKCWRKWSEGYEIKTGDYYYILTWWENKTMLFLRANADWKRYTTRRKQSARPSKSTISIAENAWTFKNSSNVLNSSSATIPNPLHLSHPYSSNNSNPFSTCHRPALPFGPSTSHQLPNLPTNPKMLRPFETNKTKWSSNRSSKSLSINTTEASRNICCPIERAKVIVENNGN